jgi:hypothetical protein
MPASAEEIRRMDHVRDETADGVGGGGCSTWEDSMRRSMTPQETPRFCLSLALSVTVVSRMPEGTSGDLGPVADNASNLGSGLG